MSGASNRQRHDKQLALQNLVYDPTLVDQVREAANLMRSRIAEREQLLVAVNLAWRIHHGFPRNSWGYTTDHEMMRNWRMELESDIDRHKHALELLAPGSVPELQNPYTTDMRRD